MNSPLTVEDGSLADYRALARFHYRAGPPATVARVHRIAMHHPTVVGRFFQRGEESQTLGVVVISYPVLGCAMRRIAMGNRYGGLPRREAARLLNCELRTISRVVIDPRCRGLGLAVRLVRYALDHAETIYTEALAAMGRVHPFFERAGMFRYDPPPDPDAERLRAAFEVVGFPPTLLASTNALRLRIETDLEPVQRAWFTAELKRTARRHGCASGSSLAHSYGVDTFAADVADARRRLFARPIYYLARSELATRNDA